MPFPVIGTLSYANGKIRAMEFTEPAADTVIRPLDDRFPVAPEADDLFGTERGTYPAGLAPVPKDDGIVAGLRFLRPGRDFLC